jgi:hypothetical protein
MFTQTEIQILLLRGSQYAILATSTIFAVTGVAISAVSGSLRAGSVHINNKLNEKEEDLSKYYLMPPLDLVKSVVQGVSPAEETPLDPLEEEFGDMRHTVDSSVLDEQVSPVNTAGIGPCPSKSESREVETEEPKCVDEAGTQTSTGQ